MSCCRSFVRGRVLWLPTSTVPEGLHQRRRPGLRHAEEPLVAPVAALGRLCVRLDIRTGAGSSTGWRPPSRRQRAPPRRAVEPPGVRPSPPVRPGGPPRCARSCSNAIAKDGRNDRRGRRALRRRSVRCHLRGAAVEDNLAAPFEHPRGSRLESAPESPPAVAGHHQPARTQTKIGQRFVQGSIQGRTGASGGRFGATDGDSEQFAAGVDDRPGDAQSLVQLAPSAGRRGATGKNRRQRRYGRPACTPAATRPPVRLTRPHTRVLWRSRGPECPASRPRPAGAARRSSPLSPSAPRRAYGSALSGTACRREREPRP